MDDGAPKPGRADRVAGAGEARISLVINTLNEEARLRWALESAGPWVDETIVVDMHSDDRTREIAEEFGARVFLHERLGYADPARAFAIDQSTGTWILILDADEVLPGALGKRLRELADAGAADVVAIPRRNFILGAEVRHTGWGRAQEYHPRFFRRSAVVASSSVHDYLRVQPWAKVIRLPPEDAFSIVHFNYVDVTQFIEKLNRYTTIEARGRPPTKGGLAFAVLAGGREFALRFIVHQGFRDGWRGFYLSLLMAMYRIAVAAKVREAAEGQGFDAVEARYESIAADLLNQPDDRRR